MMCRSSNNTPMLEISQLINRKLLFVTGKGGVGKTTVAVALGIIAASLGKRTLLVESSSQEQIAPLLGKASIGHCETSITPNFSIINLSTADNFKEYLTKHLGQKLLYDKVFSHKVMQSFIKTIPGLAEVMMLGRLYYSINLSSGQRPDLLIFDSSASGHFLSLMTTPDSVLGTGLGGPMVKEIQNVRDFMADDKKCGTIYVTIPEELVISECIDFLPKLIQNSPSKLQGLLVNKVVDAINDPTIEQNAKTIAAARFATIRQQKCETSLKKLSNALNNLDTPGVRTAYLPDLGLIKEPVTEELGRTLLREML